MATPRVTLPGKPLVLDCDKVEDDPRFIAETAKHDQLVRDKSELEQEIRQLEKSPNHPLGYSRKFEQGVQTLLADPGVEVEVRPDVGELRSKAEVHAEAIRRQGAKVEEARRRVAGQIGRQLAPQHAKLLDAFLVAQQAADEAFDNLERFRRAANAHTGVDRTLNPFFDEMTFPLMRTRYLTVIQNMRSLTTDYRNQFNG